MSRLLLIAAVACLPVRKLDPDDHEVAGLYKVSVEDGCEDAQAAEVVLAAFHKTTPVAVPESFAFIVLDPEAKQIIDPVEHVGLGEVNCTEPVKIENNQPTWVEHLVGPLQHH